MLHEKRKKKEKIDLTKFYLLKELNIDINIERVYPLKTYKTFLLNLKKNSAMQAPISLLQIKLIKVF
jgi:hypothetical protein